jgi:hypothetical protein
MSDPAGLDRRTLMKRGGLLLLGASLPIPLAACGTTTPGEAPDRTIAFLYASGPVRYSVRPLNPPLGDFARLIARRGKEKKVSFGVSSSENPRRSLNRDVEQTEFNPATNESPPLYSVIVVSAPGMPVDPGVVRAVESGVQLVSFLYPVPHAVASITVDPERMGEMLAEDILAWAREEEGGGDVLLVEPKPPSP